MARAIPSGFLTVLVGFGLAACGADEAPSGRAEGGSQGGIVVACLQHIPRVLNPFVSPDQASVDLAPLMFTPLVRYSDEGASEPIAPALARSWEWSDDGTTLHLTLRDDLTWHDGQPVTAGDVVWTLQAAADTAYGYWNREDFASLERVTAPGDGEVEIVFSAPYGPGVEPLTTLPILPRHLLGEVSPDSFGRLAYHREPVGSGPFVFRRRSAENQLVFDRNDRYPEDMGRPKVDRVVVKEIPEVAALLVELRTAQTDVCLTGPSAAREAESVESLRVLPAPPGQTQVMLLDHTSPFFDQPEERRALSAAIDRRDVASVVSPLASPARSFVPASWSVDDDSLLEPDAAGPLADSLLGRAGWTRPDPDGTRRNASGEPLSFTLMGPQGYEQVLTVLQAQLARAGIEARPRLLEGSAFIDVIQDPDRQPPAMVLGLAPSRIDAPEVRSSLHSEGGTNLGSYANPTADSLVDALAHASSPGAREAVYHQLEALVASDVPLVYLTYLPNVVVFGPRVDGISAGPAGLFASAPFWSVGAAVE